MSCSISGKTLEFTHGAAYDSNGKKYPFPWGIWDLKNDLEASIPHVLHALLVHENCLSIAYTGKQSGTIAEIPNVIRFDLYTNDYPVSYPSVFKELLYTESFAGKQVLKLYVLKDSLRLDTVVGRKIILPDGNFSDHAGPFSPELFFRQQDEDHNISTVTVNENPTRLIVMFKRVISLSGTSILGLKFTCRTLPAPKPLDPSGAVLQAPVVDPAPACKRARIVESAYPRGMRASLESECVHFSYGSKREFTLRLGYAPTVRIGAQDFKITKAMLTDGSSDNPRVVESIPADTFELLEAVQSLKDFGHSYHRSTIYFRIPQPFRILGQTGIERLEFLYHDAQAFSRKGPAAAPV